MKALKLEDFHTMSVDEIDTPVPGPGEARIRISSTGICGTDLHGFTGANGRRVPGQVMGHETVGVIDTVGAGVDLPVGATATINPVVGCGSCAACTQQTEQYCPDKRVIGVDPTRSACFAEYAIAPAANVVLLEPSVPHQYGALVEPLAVGYHAARRGGMSAAESVLVVGGGPIGQAVALAAQRLEAEQVVVSEPHAGRRALCRSIGAEVIDPSQGPVQEQVAGRFGGVTVAIDAVGSSDTLADAIGSTPMGGRVVLVGMATPRLELDNAFAISTGERMLIGSFSYNSREFSRTAEWVGTNPPELAQLIEREVPLEDAPAQFSALATELGAGKVLVDFADLSASGGAMRP